MISNVASTAESAMHAMKPRNIPGESAVDSVDKAGIGSSIDGMEFAEAVDICSHLLLADTSCERFAVLNLFFGIVARRISPTIW